jgi:capsular exopolysaccharide synthesis family protein
MELKNYLNVLWRRKWVILLTFAVTMTVVVIGTQMSTPFYQATAVLRIAVSSGGSLSAQDYIYTDQLMNTYVEMATRRPVLEELTERLLLSKAPAITVEIIPNTELIQITVENENPELTAKAANTLADILIAQGNQLYIGGEKRLSEVLGEQLAQIQADLDMAQQQYEKLIVQTPPAPEELDSSMRLLQLKQSNYVTLLAQYQQALFREEIQGSMITVFETATVPQFPSKPRLRINVLLGLVVGMAGGLGLALLFENLDTTLYTTEQIENLTRLAAVAKIPKATKKQISIDQEGFSPMEEAFRNLATYIQQSDHWHAAKVILVLGAEPNQGKSLVVARLACSLAECGKRVVAIDCDIRLPKLHSLFGLSNQFGLTDILERKMGWETTIQSSSHEGLNVLTSGTLLVHTSKLLGSSQMSELIKSLCRKADYILLDTPALLGIADVAALMQKVHGFLWVVRREHARRDAVDAARKFLSGFPEKPVGLVVNQSEDYANYGYYRYQHQFMVSPEPTTEEITTNLNVIP